VSRRCEACFLCLLVGFLCWLNLQFHSCTFVQIVKNLHMSSVAIFFSACTETKQSTLNHLKKKLVGSQINVCVKVASPFRLNILIMGRLICNNTVLKLTTSLTYRNNNVLDFISITFIRNYRSISLFLNLPLAQISATSEFTGPWIKKDLKHLQSLQAIKFVLVLLSVWYNLASYMSSLIK
jgi:hypothetical protein